jgi:hypothetical protein
MTEAEWLAGADPLPLVNEVAERAGDRRLRLLVVACARRAWHLFEVGSYREMIEMAERYCDGAVAGEVMGRTRIEARAAYDRAMETIQPVNAIRMLVPYEMAEVAFVACAEPGTLTERIATFAGRYRRGSHYVMRGVDAVAKAASYVATSEGERNPNIAAQSAEWAEQADLARDIFGNPFRPVAIEPSWRTSAVVTLARQMYESRDFTPMPIVSDALLDAGCDHSDVIAHCRSDRPHVRGCWLVDLLLKPTGYREEPTDSASTGPSRLTSDTWLIAKPPVLGS